MISTLPEWTIVTGTPGRSSGKSLFGYRFVSESKNMRVPIVPRINLRFFIYLRLLPTLYRVFIVRDDFSHPLICTGRRNRWPYNSAQGASLLLLISSVARLIRNDPAWVLEPFPATSGAECFCNCVTLTEISNFGTFCVLLPRTTFHSTTYCFLCWANILESTKVYTMTHK